VLVLVVVMVVLVLVLVENGQSVKVVGNQVPRHVCSHYYLF